MKTKNKLLFCFASSLLLGITPTSHAQFGDLLKGMKDAAKELEKASQGQPPGGTDPLQQAPQNQSNPPSSKVDQALFNKFSTGQTEGPRWAAAEDCRGEKPTVNVMVFRATTSCESPTWNIGNYTGGKCRSKSPYSAYTTRKTDQGQNLEFQWEINGVEVSNLEGVDLIKMSFELFPRGGGDTQLRFTNYFRFEGDNKFQIFAQTNDVNGEWQIKDGKYLKSGLQVPPRYNCASNSPELVAARNAIKNDPSKLKEKADVLLNLAASTYPAIKTYDWSKKQWDFNVKYGAPPVSSNYTRMVKKELPDMFKTFGACSKKLGGGDINYDIVEKYFWSTDNKDIADARKMLNFLKSMGAENAPVRVPTKRSELNAAAENEQTLRLLIIDQYNNLLKFKTDKNWCEKFKDAD